MLITAEVSFALLTVSRPFNDSLRNKFETFNEVILIVMVMTTFCFTGNMDVDATSLIGWWFLGILGFYMTVHLVSLATDTFISFCKVIWRLLAKCAFGKLI